MGSLQLVPNLDAMPTLCRRQWYAVQTRPRHEKKVVTELQDKCIDSYLPLLNQVHRWSDRRKLVQVPLFPGYVFVHAHLDPKVYFAVLYIWGVLSFVGPQREAAAIPDTQIDD